MHRYYCSLALVLLASTVANAQGVNTGKPYREITDWGPTRIAQAQPQLGSAARFVQFAPSSNAPWPIAAAPADQRPALNGVSPVTPTQYAAYQQPNAYGYGFVNGCAWNRPVGYANTLPPPSFAAMSNIQPISANVPIGQPLGGLQPVPNAQPWSVSPFNPYQGAERTTPWRPLVPIRSMPTNYEIGQGVVGQPKIYVPNQPLRNFLRYLTP